MSEAQRRKLVVIKTLQDRRDAVQAYLDTPGKIQVYKSHCPTRETHIVASKEVADLIEAGLYHELIVISKELINLITK